MKKLILLFIFLASWLFISVYAGGNNQIWQNTSQWITARNSDACPINYIPYTWIIYDVEWEGSCVPINLFTEADRTTYADAFARYNKKHNIMSDATVTLSWQIDQHTTIWNQLSKIETDTKQKLDSELEIITRWTKKQIQALIVSKIKRKQTYMKIQKSITLNLKKTSKLPDSPEKTQLIGQYKWQIEYVKWRIVSVNLVINSLKEVVKLR
jgi:hypothetical protein